MTHDFACRLPLSARPERIHDALAHLDGLRGWRTPVVCGSPAVGGRLHFGFPGLDEHSVMRVDASTIDAESGASTSAGPACCIPAALRGTARG